MTGKQTPMQLRRRIERDRRARRLYFMRQRRPDSVRTSTLAVIVTVDRLNASMESAARSIKAFTVAMSKMGGCPDCSTLASFEKVKTR